MKIGARRYFLAKWLAGVFFLIGGLVLVQGEAAAFTNFSTGMLTPETISPANSAYGGRYDNYYFVPDPGRVSGNPAQTNIWLVPKTGGSPLIFSPTSGSLNSTTVGGTFLPSGWGTSSNKFMTVGWTGSSPNRIAYFNVYEADGSYSSPLSIAEPSGQVYLPKTPVVAPSGWGSWGGNLFVADGAPAVYRIDTSWQKHDFVTLGNTPYPELARFGLAFAPTGWGRVGNELLASSDLRETDSLGNIIRITGRITAIDSSGVESKWAEFPIPVNLNGLRQMAFTPDDFIPGYDELLLVSVSGSSFGGGTLGDIWAFDSTGHKVASLRDDLGLTKFDPRGMYFVDDHTLLVSDASDPIWRVTSSDFRPVVPLPSTLWLFGSALVGLAGCRRFIKG
jgi:hypothetical protein